ncbi:hypothetical protein GQ54DRAFT_5793 [Martensiomyces pterosporus]|nr:hypothetical protein GQ54DRAFT_5793 [Martensiomyces pterosporus]
MSVDGSQCTGRRGVAHGSMTVPCKAQNAGSRKQGNIALIAASLREQATPVEKRKRKGETWEERDRVGAGGALPALSPPSPSLQSMRMMATTTTSSGEPGAPRWGCASLLCLPFAQCSKGNGCCCCTARQRRAQQISPPCPHPPVQPAASYAQG